MCICRLFFSCWIVFLGMNAEQCTYSNLDSTGLPPVLGIVNSTYMSMSPVGINIFVQGMYIGMKLLNKN